MIKRPTTFVVGAGGSVSYYLPTGAELLSRARQLVPGAPVYVALHGNKGGPIIDQINNAIQVLRDHPAGSIDAVIDTRPDLDEIGRQIIAGLMALAIDEVPGLVQKGGTTGPDVNDDWLGLILEEMWSGCRTPESFANKNDVAFVTFNFDSVIEQRITKTIAAAYKGTVASAINSVPVWHMHGRLGDVPNAAKLSSEWVHAAAEDISVIHSAKTSNHVKAARERLEQSEVVCFLGFGYHRLNLEHLRITQTLKHEPEVFGTAFDVKKGERQRITDRFPKKRIGLGDENQKSRDFLLGTNIFKD